MVRYHHDLKFFFWTTEGVKWPTGPGRPLSSEGVNGINLNLYLFTNQTPFCIAFSIRKAAVWLYKTVLHCNSLFYFSENITDDRTSQRPEDKSVWELSNSTVWGTCTFKAIEKNGVIYNIRLSKCVFCWSISSRDLVQVSMWTSLLSVYTDNLFDDVTDIVIIHTCTYTCRFIIQLFIDK